MVERTEDFLLLAGASKSRGHGSNSGSDLSPFMSHAADVVRLPLCLFQKLSRRPLRSANAVFPQTRDLFRMKVFVQKTTPAYLQIRRMLLSEEPPLSDADRDRIDWQFRRFLEDCSKSIDELKVLAAATKSTRTQTAAKDSARPAAADKDNDDDDDDGTLANHRMGVVIALLDRLSSLHRSLASLQTTRYEVRTSCTDALKSAFLGWPPVARTQLSLPHFPFLSSRLSSLSLSPLPVNPPGPDKIWRSRRVAARSKGQRRAR